MKLTSAINSVLARLNLRVIRAHRHPVCSANLLDLAIPYLLAAGPDFFFVQVGANDGVGSDPLRHLVFKHRLKGLLVEPVPQFFEQLKKNYESQKQLLFANCAVAAQDGTVQLFRSISLQNASLDKGQLLKLGLPESDIVPETVPCYTFKTLMANHQVGSISLLVADCEGFDLQVLKMCFTSGFLPRAIFFESINMSPQECWECRELLHGKGYKLVESNVDTLAVLLGA